MRDKEEEKKEGRKQWEKKERKGKRSQGKIVEGYSKKESKWCGKEDRIQKEEYRIQRTS